MNLTELWEITDNDVGTMTVVHPSTFEAMKDGNGKPMEIDFVHYDSPRYREAQRAYYDAINKDGAKLETGIENIVNIVVPGIVGWRGVGIDEDVSECTLDKKRAAMIRLGWLRSQCNEFLGDRRNFFGQGRKRSSATPNTNSGSGNKPKTE